ncbi:hypothetical protein CEQ90_03260 [Lewinellaceae bacterium SD302]|nr:hypothetical protein CEQ90_03260 [Lewinellaceae bacterium SD302]
MATIQSNPTPNPKPNYTPPKKDNTKSTIMTVAIVALAALLAFTTYGWLSGRTDNAELTTELNETIEFRAQAEQQYYEAIAELEEMRGSNEEMNALIDQQKAELKTMKEKVDGLTRDSRNLSNARRELAALREQADSYIAELNTLREENAMLTENNRQLTTERDELNTNLQTSQMENEELNATKAVLVSERDQLTNVNEQLSRKVTAGSVIAVNSISAVGQKQRNSGKFVDRNSAKNVDRLYVCFSTLENKVAEAGEEVYYLRVIDPSGATISLDAQGSGNLKSEENGDMIPYTKPVYFDFDGGTKNLCAEWNEPGYTYTSGDYTIELYNKGYLAGSTSMRLK